MKFYASFSLLAAVASAQSLIESSSFGWGQTYGNSPAHYAIGILTVLVYHRVETRSRDGRLEEKGMLRRLYVDACHI